MIKKKIFFFPKPPLPAFLIQQCLGKHFMTRTAQRSTHQNTVYDTENESTFFAHACGHVKRINIQIILSYQLFFFF